MNAMSGSVLHPLYPMMLAAAIGSTVFAPRASAAVAGPKRAVWAEHDLRIELPRLPRHYSCDELNEKVHDVLLAIGARADMRVRANRCTADFDITVPPRVHVIFSLPVEVHGQLAKSADMFAVERTVRIEPGNPPSIDFSDCEFLRQLNLTLFPAVYIPIQVNHLACRPTAAGHTPFSVLLDALLPAPEPAKAGLLQPTFSAQVAPHGI